MQKAAPPPERITTATLDTVSGKGALLQEKKHYATRKPSGLYSLGTRIVRYDGKKGMPAVYEKNEEGLVSLNDALRILERRETEMDALQSTRLKRYHVDHEDALEDGTHYSLVSPAVDLTAISGVLRTPRKGALARVFGAIARFLPRRPPEKLASARLTDRNDGTFEYFYIEHQPGYAPFYMLVRETGAHNPNIPGTVEYLGHGLGLNAALLLLHLRQEELDRKAACEKGRYYMSAAFGGMEHYARHMRPIGAALTCEGAGTREDARRPARNGTQPALPRPR